MNKVKINGRWVSASNPPTISEVWHLVLPAKHDAIRTLTNLIAGLETLVVALEALLAEHPYEIQDPRTALLWEKHHARITREIGKNQRERNAAKLRYRQMVQVLEWYDNSVS